jgi:transposase-like protein
MPWKASSVMEELLRFVARLLDGEAMTEVCRDFGIYRRTGYKIFDRYKEHGLEALSDRSRRPVRYANQLPQQLETVIVRLKSEKPHWGARKIRELLGAMACILVLFTLTPPPSSLSQYVLMRTAMAGIATWIFLPSLALTLVAGLLAIAVNRAFHNAGWAWVKLATGILVFEWGFAAVQGPMEQEAELGARVLAGQADAATLATSLGPEQNSLWVLLAVATANVVLGIWRPRLTRIPD